MPIRINLLAEAQAAEELRRKDPVKRAIWIAGFFVCVVLLWMLKLQLDIYFTQNDFTSIDKRATEINAKYAAVTNNLIRTAQVDQKLAALDRLTTNRFLWAPLLNAFQKSMVEGIQITRLSGDQRYTKEDPRTIGSGSSRMTIPGGVVEKISLHIEARDMNPNEQGYTKYKENLGSCDYFLKRLKRRDGFVLDGTLSPPSADPSDPSRQFVTFALVSHFPEVRRGE
ncbi:MAG: hypothetical protein ABSH38_14465 [Verrucomicrobiota bacterium]